MKTRIQEWAVFLNELRRYEVDIDAIGELPLAATERFRIVFERIFEAAGPIDGALDGDGPDDDQLYSQILAIRGLRDTQGRAVSQKEKEAYGTLILCAMQRFADACLKALKGEVP